MIACNLLVKSLKLFGLPGEKALYEAYTYMVKIGELMFGKMKDDSIKLCLQLLEDSTVCSSEFVAQYKNNDFDDTYEKPAAKKTKAVKTKTCLDVLPEMK